MGGRLWKPKLVIMRRSDFRNRGGAYQVTVSWIDVVPFWWFGASGLGPELVAKPVIFSYAKAVGIRGQFGGSIGQQCWHKGWCSPCGAIRANLGLRLVIWRSGSFAASAAVLFDTVHRRILVQEQQRSRLSF
ncbi:hypothetical protein MELB17_00920 [Marinobacter sp. ELB17]|nr:hypothetical protein MELB17_00920 [Marinobacter sp. ELB17]